MYKKTFVFSLWETFFHAVSTYPFEHDFHCYRVFNLGKKKKNNPSRVMCHVTSEIILLLLLFSKKRQKMHDLATINFFFFLHKLVLSKSESIPIIGFTVSSLNLFLFMMFFSFSITTQDC